MVETSCRRGTLETSSGCGASRLAARIGRAAFLAPETATAPLSGRRQGAHRQRVDLLAHAVSERAVHQLVPLHQPLALEKPRDDQRFEVLPVAVHFEGFALEACGDVAFDVVGSHHDRSLAVALSSAGGAPARAGSWVIRRARGARRSQCRSL
jgi:hypothetical protein